MAKLPTLLSRTISPVSARSGKRPVPSIIAGDACSLAVGSALEMAMPARTVSNKTSKAGGSGLSSLLFEGTHYERSPEATPRASITMQLARM